MTLSAADLKSLTSRIQERRAELAQEILGDEQKLAADRASRLRGEADDAADHTVADLLGEVGQAEMTRDLDELRAYDAALARIQGGAYGECIDCAEAVGVERLQANPAAARCIR